MMNIPNLSVSSILMMILASFILSSCASIQTGTHYDEEYFFKGYKTFSWISKEPIEHKQEGSIRASPLTMKKIVESIQSELQNKGYQYVESLALADFSLSYTIGSRKEFSIDSYPVEYRQNWGWYSRGTHHEFGQWHMKSWTEGTLTIDIFDNKISQPIWHGWATKIISKADRKDPTESIHSAVAKIFETFPIYANE